MGGLGGRKRNRNNNSQNSGNYVSPVRKVEYADDGVRPMPSLLNPLSLELAREKRLEMVSKSGRTSTNLAGTVPYTNTFLGGTQ